MAPNIFEDISEPNQELMDSTKRRAMDKLGEGKLQEALDFMIAGINDENSGWSPAHKQQFANMALQLRNKIGLTEKEVRDFIQGF